MRSDLLAEAAASIAAVAAAIALFYAREAAHAGRDAVAAARRTMELADLSRRAAERARLRQRVERVGELVQEILMSSLFDPGIDGLSPRTRGQCNVLNQAVIGLKELLPKSAAVSSATSPVELQRRAGLARVEVDAVLARLARRRPRHRFRRASVGVGGRRHPRQR
jgi:hypothetical protein